MNLKLIIPRDPLIFRDGKPFTAVPGERAKSIPFPFPATLAGAVRTRAGTKDGEFDKTKIKSLLEDISIRGPFLVELDSEGNIKRREEKDIDCFFPTPADALLITENKITTRYSLVPLNVSEDWYSIENTKLKLIGTKKPIKAKPTTNPPLYWSWKLMKEWLLNPPEEEIIDLDTFDAIKGPESETRTHVSIDKGTQTALSGALFQTSGMEFIKKNKKLSEARQLALAIETSATLTDGVDSLGGERRVVHWESSSESLPACDEKLKTQIKNQRHCRLVLATPAYFENGYLPKNLEEKYKLEIQAVALPRYQTISGWDYAANDGKGAPKETRRLVPAGSVYFIKFEEQADIESFINKFWLNSICEENSQEARDGFGIALIGTWKVGGVT